MPIIDWYGATDESGKAVVTVLGFAAFYVNNINGQNITGTLVEYTDASNGSYDPTIDAGMDGGAYSARMDG